MSITLTITGATGAELRDGLLELVALLEAQPAAAGNGRMHSAPAPEPDADLDLGGDESDNEAAEAAAVAEAEAKAAKKAAAAAKKAAAAAKPVTIDEVRDVLTEHMGRFKQKATTALVKEIAGVQRVSEIEPKFYAPLIAAAKAELTQ